jgi:dTDP-4-amino-4,6-dideoxygalactose transaminase
MKVPFLDLKTQYRRLKPELDAAFADIFENAAFICGRYVREFEQAFAAAIGVRGVVATGNGTQAVHLMLWAAGIGPGEEVIVPVNTFIATAEGVSACGATPVFVDSDPVTYNIDLGQVEGKITPRTKALLPVHLYGQPVDMGALAGIARQHHLLIFEDACQAQLAKCQGKAVGNFGLAAAFSFFPGKNLGAYGEAGAVCTNDEELHQKVLRMRGHGSVERYVHEIVGHNFRMEEIQAAVLLVKLKYLEAWNSRRRAIAGLYRSGLKDVTEVVCPSETHGCCHIYHLLVVRVPAPKRDALRAALQAKDIATGLHYPIPLHLQAAYAHLGYRRGDFPVAEAQAGEIVSLPMCPEMKDEQVEYVCENIRSFFGR